MHTTYRAFAAIASMAVVALAPTRAAAATPEVADDHLIITFDAPARAAVQIVSDMIPGGRANMIYSYYNGRWEYQVQPGRVLPDLYTYTVEVDGVPTLDTASTYILTTDEGATLNYAIVPGSESAALVERADVPHGVVATFTYTSPQWGERRAAVYTPPGYESADTTRRYPVLYLLHGTGGGTDSWLAQGRARQQLDNMIASGQAVPMIVVMPDANIEGHYLDGEFELEFPRLMEAIDGSYLTRTDAASRAIAGLSMGGYHAMNISRYYPGTFDFVGLFSPAMLVHATRPDAEPYRDAEAALRRQFDAGLQLYFVAMGTADPLKEQLAPYLQQMAADKLPVYSVTSPDGHDWHAWRTYLREFLPLIFRQ